MSERTVRKHSERQRRKMAAENDRYSRKNDKPTLVAPMKWAQ